MSSTGEMDQEVSRTGDGSRQESESKRALGHGGPTLELESGRSLREKRGWNGDLHGNVDSTS